MNRNTVFLVMVILLGCISITATNCNWVAKEAGGTITVHVGKGQKLVNATWKESNLWILTRDMKPEETSEKYTFQEYSNFGILEGTVILEESK